MNERNSTSKFDIRLAVVLIIYVILGLFLIKYYRYQINPDGISYISIARKYLNSDFTNVVNGYWGPLLSWLLMPFLYFGSDALLAGKTLTLFTGIAAFIALRALSYRFEMVESVRTIILFSAIPVILSFAFSDITPDLLLTTILLFYFAVIFSANYAERINKGLFCGILGGSAYLAKSFAFPFFISHFFIMNAFHYLRSETKEAKKKVFHNFLAGAIVFALISGVWIGLISDKYGEFLFGGAGRMALRGFAAPGGKGAPVLWQGFFEPSNETAISVWEDPCYMEMPFYNPIASWPYFKHQLKFAVRNIYKIAGIFMNFSLLSIATGIAYLLFWMKKLNKTTILTILPEVLYPTVTIVLFAGGYSLVWVEARYLWVIFIMSMLMGGYVLCRLFQSKFFTKTRRTVLLVVFFLSFAVPASQDLKAHVNRGKGIYDLSEVLKSRIAPGCNIASNTSWGGSLYLSYHLGCKYYGAQAKSISEVELKRQLEKYGIDYYLVWGDAASDLSFLSDYQEITGGRIPGLGIYSLKKPR